ncbi:hypothetical protein LL946_04700 [Knoellia locipacati]|uniref:hypothetical protein n=1 Tax=Knoellia locipacati TaxID=882824 RepID=UPI00384BF863
MAIGQMEKGAELKAALEGCGPLGCPGPEVERLWLEIRDCVCTRGRADVVPYGSGRAVTVTEDYASDELLSAMEWLIKNEEKARSLEAESLFAHLSAEAKRSAKGSGRAARNDQLHGVTNVSAGDPIHFYELDAPREES